MNVKTFCAPSVLEALAGIRREMGPDAVILSTVESPLSVARRFEVTAAVEPRRAVAPAFAGDPRGGSRLPAGPAQSRGAVAAGAPFATPAAERSDGALVRRLLDQDVDETLAAALASRVAGSRDPEAGLAALLRSMVKPAPAPRKNGVTVLVGGTGVGKTTTLAKLAAGPLAAAGLSPAFVTCDTWRVAAVEQLAVFADVLEIPFAAAYTPEELAGEVARLREAGHHVLVDTPGRSLRDTAGLRQLQEFVTAVGGRTTHLVVPGTLKARDVAPLWRASEPFAVDHLIFSRLDETSSHGPVLSVLAKARRPVSWVTFGQNVPEDIAGAESLDPARLILDGEFDVRFDRKTA